VKTYGVVVEKNEESRRTSTNRVTYLQQQQNYESKTVDVSMM